MSLAYSNILTAFQPSTVGTKVLLHAAFAAVLQRAVQAADFSTGVAVVKLPDAVNLVSTGVGRRTSNPADFVCREWRGRVESFLTREHALPCASVIAIVYTKAAYLAEDDLSHLERGRIERSDCDMVVVSVRAEADGAPDNPPTSPYRTVYNQAGGNCAAMKWDLQRVREECIASIAYDRMFCVVAD